MDSPDTSRTGAGNSPEIIIQPHRNAIEGPKNGEYNDDGDSKHGSNVVCLNTSPRLPFLQRLSYGVGHVLNDLCASMWFSYLLLYLTSVVNFSNSMAGGLLLLGQIADALATPFVGHESDEVQLCSKYGRRKGWHLVGIVCVACSYPFLFNPWLGPEAPQTFALFVYYAPFVVIFQFGWATTQISHLGLLPTLTECENQRVELNAIRNAFTLMANIAVYSATWVLLSHGTSPSDMNSITPNDAPTFRLLVLGAVGVGILFCIWFHLGTRESARSDQLQLTQSAEVRRSEKLMEWRDWFKEPQFYQVAFIYMTTRLIVNMSQVYMPMYVLHSLKLDRDHVAIVPLVVFVSGFLATFIMKPINKKIGRKWTFLLGLATIGGSCLWMWFINECVNKQLVIGAAVLLGIGSSTILITSLSMTSDLIGTHTESGAFVYGCMSFVDKLSNGAVVMIIQYLHPCNALNTSCCPACVWYYRDIMVLVLGGIAVGGVVMLLTMIRTHLGTLKHDAAIRSPVINGERERLLHGSETPNSYNGT